MKNRMWAGVIVVLVLIAGCAKKNEFKKPPPARGDGTKPTTKRMLRFIRDSPVEWWHRTA